MILSQRRSRILALTLPTNTLGFSSRNQRFNSPRNPGLALSNTKTVMRLPPVTSYNLRLRYLPRRPKDHQHEYRSQHLLHPHPESGQYHLEWVTFVPGPSSKQVTPDTGIGILPSAEMDTMALSSFSMTACST